jgi:hypothetical protein
VLLSKTFCDWSHPEVLQARATGRAGWDPSRSGLLGNDWRYGILSALVSPILHSALAPLPHFAFFIYPAPRSPLVTSHRRLRRVPPPSCPSPTCRVYEPEGPPPVPLLPTSALATRHSSPPLPLPPPLPCNHPGPC